MTDQLIVRTDKNSWTLPLRKASLKLGSDTKLELCVPHPEVMECAATIDNRGQSPLIINNNPYAIYVGPSRVEPSACSPWSTSDLVQLTKNVTLELVPSAGVDSVLTNQRTTTKPVESTKVDSRQMLQVGMIVVCCLLGALTMLKSDASEYARERYSFTELLQETTQLRGLNPGTAEDLDGLLTALQDAHVTEIRWRQSDPQRVVSAYNRLLQSAIVRRPTELQRELASKVKLFGSQRIQEIWRVMDYHQQ